MSNKQVEQLIIMVNQITDNNNYHNDEVKVIEVSLDHLVKFWAVSMKKMIIDYAKNDSNELNPISQKTIAQLAELYR